MGTERYVYARVLFLAFGLLITEAYRYESGIRYPDFQSSWTTLKSTVVEEAAVTINHGLGEVPAIVDVQVKSIEEPNKDFVFSGVGGCPRDDDEPESYGGTIYLYNEDSVQVSVPYMRNDYTAGSALYTGDLPYWTGQNFQESKEVMVRVRAWKMASLPAPDFVNTSIHVQTRTGNSNDVYIEKSHGLLEVPALVIVRIKLLDGNLVGWYSDTVGANIVSYEPGHSNVIRHVIHGFNDYSIRIWAPDEGDLFRGNDGYGIDTRSDIGEVEIYAWKHSSIKPFLTSTFQLGPSEPGETFERSFCREKTLDDLFVKVWVQAQSGTNAGYIFPGSGAAAYVPSPTGQPCSYGGLLYAHSLTTVRLWRPATGSSGSLICISEYMGNGINQQSSMDALVIIRVWSFMIHEQANEPEPAGVCIITTT